MKDNLKSTVVIVNLNQGKFLKECLDSVVKQTYSDIEILVIDGGSQDESLDILRKYPLVSWISESDNSYGHAFVKGVKRAQGEIIFFLTSTDGFVDEKWIEKAMSEFYENPELSLVAADVIGINSTSVPNGYKWPAGAPKVWNNDKVFMSWLLDGGGVTPISFGVRRKVLLKCAPMESKMGNPHDLSSVDFFWYFFGEFFKTRFLSKKLDTVSSYVRFHHDRTNDSEYLNRQQSQLANLILANRKKIILERKTIDFINPDFDVLPSYEIAYPLVIIGIVKSKLLHIFSFLLQSNESHLRLLVLRIFRKRIPKLTVGDWIDK
jgi:glycosyltransferase involved in cell wall biosynthesis